MAAPVPPPPSGFVFCPADHQLITQFLSPRIAAGADGRFGSFIHEADAYSAAPADLVDGREHAPGTHKLNKGKSGGHWYSGTSSVERALQESIERTRLLSES